jgi:hypothetical protein
VATKRSPFFCYGLNDAHPAIVISQPPSAVGQRTKNKCLFQSKKHSKTIKKTIKKISRQETPHNEEMAGKFLGAHFAKVSLV